MRSAQIASADCAGAAGAWCACGAGVAAGCCARTELANVSSRNRYEKVRFKDTSGGVVKTANSGSRDRTKKWRRGSESNRRIKVLQTSPLPLGYRAVSA